MKKILIIGCGGHAKVVYECLVLNGYSVTVVLEKDHLTPSDDFFRELGVLVANETKFLENVDSKNCLLANGIGSVSVNELRKNIFLQFSKKGFQFPVLRHPSSIVSNFSQIGAGSQILAGSIVGVNSRIGENVLLNSNSTVDHDCVIGNHVHIAPGAVISGGVTIGENSLIGAGSVIRQGVTIGVNCLVAAGAVVVSNQIDGKIVKGVPAK